MTAALLFLITLMCFGSLVAIFGLGAWLNNRDAQREHEQWMATHADPWTPADGTLPPSARPTS